MRRFAAWTSLALALAVIVTAIVVAVFPPEPFVAQPASIPATRPYVPKSPVAVSVTFVGATTTALLARGGRATSPSQGGDAGQVGYRVP